MARRLTVEDPGTFIDLRRNSRPPSPKVINPGSLDLRPSSGDSRLNVTSVESWLADGVSKNELYFDFRHSATNKTHNWLKQPDSTSCGIYLIHNAQPYMNFSDYEGGPEQAFETMTQTALEEGNTLARNRNIPMDALCSYFTGKGFNAYASGAFDNPENVARAVLESGAFELVCTTSGVHYTGIVKNGDGFLHIDPHTDGPSQISLEEATQKIVASTGQGRAYTLSRKSGSLKLSENPDAGRHDLFMIISRNDISSLL